MPIPTYTSLLLPLLQLAGDGAEHRSADAVTLLADYIGLTDAERSEPTPNGRQSRFAHRVHYARAMLKRAGLLATCQHGVFRITPLGLRVLADAPLHIDRAFLMQFPQFADYATRMQPERSADAEPTDYDSQEQTPRELIHILYNGLQKELTDELLEAVVASSPAFFERLVIDLLLAMGYGGSRKEAGRRLGRTGDGGLDGVIQEDKLGLDMIYVQAKRWALNSTVGRPVVQAFLGSLLGVGAARGVLLTTARFSSEAVEYAARMQQHTVILVDGARLAGLMLEHNVGVSVEATYTLKRLDTAYFDGEQA
jgi:restriction system protein